MRVNSVFTGCSFRRLVTGPGVTLALLIIFFIASSFKKHPGPDLWAKQVNVIIRQIGHRLLLQAGDSTSRVLPVTEIQEGTFQLRFESEFVFSHDSLLALSLRLLPKRQFPSGYTVTVQDCRGAAIVYGFQLSNTSPDALPCTGRNQPRGCYIIEFAFSDFYEIGDHENSEGEKIESERANLETTQQNDLELESIEQKNANLDQLIQKIKSAEVDSENDDSKVEELETTTPNYSLINLVWSGMLLLSSVALLIGRFRKISKPVFEKNQNQAAIKESVGELPALGRFLFDVKSKRLLLGSEVISLTDKECKILELLHKSFGELIPRETLMQEVWINEGVITGRSLDMFVSKLRKKLSRDPELRITNVHGKGYTLEITRM